jgi:hypothetical protein
LFLCLQARGNRIQLWLASCILNFVCSTRPLRLHCFRLLFKNKKQVHDKKSKSICLSKVVCSEGKKTCIYSLQLQKKKKKNEKYHQKRKLFLKGLVVHLELSDLSISFKVQQSMYPNKKKDFLRLFVNLR